MFDSLPGINLSVDSAIAERTNGYFCRSNRSTMDEFLKPTDRLNYEHPVVQEWVNGFRHFPDKETAAKALYLDVRDRFLYDPYHLDLRAEALTASAVFGNRRAWCVEKAIVCAAGFRALGIPARLGFGIVKNHIGVEKLVYYLRKDEIVFHGFVEAYLNGKWTKCTPAFDRRICRLNGVDPLEWDGTHDSLFQAWRGEEQYMEYLHFYGMFDDVPLVLMHAEMYAHYPHLFHDPIDTDTFSFHFDPMLISPL